MKTFLEIEPQLNMLYSEHKKLSELLTYPEVLLDSKLSVKLQKQEQLIKPIADKFENYLSLKNSVLEFENLLSSSSVEDKNFIVSELELASFQLECLKQELVCLFVTLNAEIQNIVVEVVPNKNSESEKLKSTIILGYEQFCLANGFSFNVQTVNDQEVVNVSGLNALELFKSEIGVHAKSDNSKINYCSVFVYEKLENTNNAMIESDVKIDACRSSGAGGQHVNTTNSMIRATHLPTGISVVCQDERSQFQNKQKALDSLREKVESYYSLQTVKQIESFKREQSKQIKKGVVTKVYDFNNQTIVASTGNTIALEDFIAGKII